MTRRIRRYSTRRPPRPNGLNARGRRPINRGSAGGSSSGGSPRAPAACRPARQCPRVASSTRRLSADRDRGRRLRGRRRAGVVDRVRAARDSSGSSTTGPAWTRGCRSWCSAGPDPAASCTRSSLRRRAGREAVAHPGRRAGARARWRRRPPATAADLPALAEIRPHRRTVRDRLRPSTRPRRRRRAGCPPAEARPRAVAGDLAVGSALLHVAAAADLEQLSVQPASTGHGIGSAPVEAAREQARTQGFAEISLSTTRTSLERRPGTPVAGSRR